MLRISDRAFRTGRRLAVALAVLLTLTAAACGDDSSEQPAAQDTQPTAQTEQQAQPTATAQADQQTQSAQTEPATQQQAQTDQQTQTDSASQPAQAQQSQAQQQTAPQQENQPEPAASDPDRDTLLDGERLAATLGPDETEKQYRFQAAAGAWLRISVDGKDGMDPIVTLLQPDGVEIAVNDDLSATNRDSLLIAQVDTEGLHLIRVQPFDTNSAGDFIIQVETLELDLDNDNAVIALGENFDGRLSTPEDLDVFEFQLSEGEPAFVLVDGDTGVDVLAHLFDSNGDLIQVDDDGGHGLDAEIYFTADITGLWRVEVWPATNKAGQRQLIGAYRITAAAGLPISEVNEAVANDLASSALTFLQALRDGDAATILALAGPEALTTWGWELVADVERDLRKIQSIDLGGEILQSAAYGDVLHPARGRVYFQFTETDWMRLELIQLGGRWLIDDWAHSIGPPS